MLLGDSSDQQTTAIRIDDSVLARAARIAKALSRSRNWVIQQAVDRYLDYEE
ncbi:MAG: CopG family ribbon-helix-helix protein [Acidiferrobacterales bacterium]|nr:ribbon-helix-helix domain-containing protein [Gammaproteobacteria bacterium]